MGGSVEALSEYDPGPSEYDPGPSDDDPGPIEYEPSERDPVRVAPLRVTPSFNYLLKHLKPTFFCT